MRNMKNGSEKTIVILGLLVICLTVGLVILVAVMPHNNPDDIINYPIDANQMAIENTMDRGMVEQPASKFEVIETTCSGYVTTPQ